MATQPPAAEPRLSSDSTSTSRKLIEYEEFIESQLRKTRGHVRGVDLATQLLSFVAGMLGYLLLVGLVDHWVVSGGLGFWGRLFFLAGGILLAGYLAARTLPLLLKRINPLYAAQTIERSRPALKNGLLNFLFLREVQEGVNPAVYQAIEEQAATNLAHNHEEVAVDRTQLIRIGYVLVGILALCAVYTLVSPKDLFRTAGRVIMPWAEIEAPTRTLITLIEPGSVQAIRGERVTVKARIENLSDAEKVTLFYSTADGQTVDHAVEMRLPPDGYKFECLVPAGDVSLQQSLVYRIQAGDAVSPNYRIDVTSAPTILVRSVEYQYPKYTGLQSQRVENQGDLKAIEGTQVTLEAQANEPIESAHVDMNCDDQLDRRMTTDGERASATFYLTLAPDRQTPTYHAYHLIFKNKLGQRNPQPVRHQIEVTRDLSPEIQFLAPVPTEIDLPLDAAVEMEVAANDPDFALRSIKLVATATGQPLLDKLLLDEVWRGQAVKKFRFSPSKLALKVGDTVEYLAVAEDNKDPQPNRAETAVRRIRITSPSGKKADERVAQRSPENQSRDQAGGDQAGGNQNDQARTPDDAPGAGKPDDAAEAAEKSDATSQPAGEQREADPQTDSAAAEQPAGEKAGEAGESGAAKSGEGGQDSAGQDGGGQGAKAEGGDEPGAASDGSNDGEAIDRILKQIEEQKSGAQGDRPEQSASDKPDQKAGGSKSQQPSKSGDSAEPKSEAKKPGDKAGDKSPDPSRPHDNQPEGQREPNAQQPSGKQPDKQNSGGKQQPDKQPSDPNDKGKQPQDPADAKPSGDKQDGSEKDPKQPAGGEEKGSGEKGNQDQGKQGEGKQDQGKQGEKGKQGAGEKGSQPRPGGDSAGDDAKPPQAGDKSEGKNDGPGKQSSQEAKPDPNSDAAGEGGKPEPGKGQPSGKPSDPNDPKSTDKSATDPAGEKGDKSQQPGAASEPAAADADGQNADKGQGSQDPSGGKQQDLQAKGDRDKSAKPDEKSGEKSRESLTPDGQFAEDAEGQGAQSQDDPTAKRDPQAPRDKQGSNSKGGDSEKHKGNSGAGQRGQESKGSPSADQANQPREKRPQQSQEDQEQRPHDQAQSPSTSHRESDSEGQDSGDRSGGGKQGGGQKANKSGTGGAGQNTSADEGAGKSDEAGGGEDSKRAGADREAGQKTGQQGKGKGAGSTTQPGDEAGDKSSTQSEPQPDAPGSPSSQPNADQPGNGGGSPSGADPTGAGSNPNPNAASPNKAGQDQADKANLDYARKATDLALRHLKEELAKDQPDPELLKKLGWSRDDMQRFIDRWEQMRAKAGTGGAQGTAAQRELDETLRSLGLRPRGATLQGSSARGNKVQGNREVRRATPPAEFAEEYKAYTEGTARGGK